MPVSNDPRWSDDARHHSGDSRDLSRGARGGPDERSHDRVDPRDVFVQHVALPRCREREHVVHRGREYTLRGSESRTLSSVGAFRVVPAHDLRDSSTVLWTRARASCGTFARRAWSGPCGWTRTPSWLP